MKPEFFDRRKFPRVKMDCSIFLEVGGMKVAARLNDISESGMSIFCPKLIEDFTILEMTIVVTHHNVNNMLESEIVCQAITVRSEEFFDPISGNGYKMAMFFSQISAESRKVIVLLAGKLVSSKLVS